VGRGQEAEEVDKVTDPSLITQLGAGAVFSLIVIEKVFNFVKGKNGNGNGKAGMLLDHEKRLTTTETRQLNIIKGMDEWRAENTKAHDTITSKLDAIAR